MDFPSHNIGMLLYLYLTHGGWSWYLVFVVCIIVTHGTSWKEHVCTFRGWIKVHVLGIVGMFTKWFPYISIVAMYNWAIQQIGDKNITYEPYTLHCCRK